MCSLVSALWGRRFRLPTHLPTACEIRKLREYCLNSRHPPRRNNARVFASVGITKSDAEELRNRLLAAAREGGARLGVANPHGQRYVLDFVLPHRDRIVKIGSTWIVRVQEDLPRLTSCYVL